MPTCAECRVYVCRTGDNLQAAPSDCPMRGTTATGSRSAYAEPFTREVARTAAFVEAEGYTRWNRVEETVEFAHRLGFRRLGLAFCMGLREEGRTLNRILVANGFEVASVVCKSGSIPKEELGISDAQKVRPGQYEAICNPIGQARVLNEAETELNIILGLCVGHDSMFIKHSTALVTCLVAKDRALAHNPIGGIYCSDSYYRERLYTQHRRPADAGRESAGARTEPGPRPQAPTSSVD